MKHYGMRPSNLLKLALRDLRKCEKDKNYKIEMWSWHKWNGKKCYICLGGAVMAQTCGVPLRKSVVSVPDEKWNDRIRALDYFRVGRINMALHELRIDVDGFDSIDVPEYNEDREGFYEVMKEIISLLKENGL